MGINQDGNGNDPYSHALIPINGCGKLLPYRIYSSNTRLIQYLLCTVPLHYRLYALVRHNSGPFPVFLFFT